MDEDDAVKVELDRLLALLERSMSLWDDTYLTMRSKDGFTVDDAKANARRALREAGLESAQALLIRIDYLLGPIARREVE